MVTLDFSTACLLLMVTLDFSTACLLLMVTLDFSTPCSYNSSLVVMSLVSQETAKRVAHAIRPNKTFFIKMGFLVNYLVCYFDKSRKNNCKKMLLIVKIEQLNRKKGVSSNLTKLRQ